MVRRGERGQGPARPTGLSTYSAPCSRWCGSGANSESTSPTLATIIFANPKKPVARYLDESELNDWARCWTGTERNTPGRWRALRLLAWLSEVLNLRWDEIGELGEDGASARLADSKTGPRTIWLGSEAARLVAALPRTEETEQLFPEDLTANRLYAFWVGVR